MTGRRPAKVKPDWPDDDWSWDRTLEVMAEGAKAAPAKRQPRCKNRHHSGISG